MIDLPPGTGDVSMTLAQLLPQAKFVVVTTPQPAAQKVAKRAAEITAQRFDLEIAGVIENMSGFTTQTASASRSSARVAASYLADELDVPLLGKIPLRRSCGIGADIGEPLVVHRSGRARFTGHLPHRPRPDRRDPARKRRCCRAPRPSRAT